MNYEKIFRESILDIKSKWKLPSVGFLAGGSIANTIWQKISGNTCPINDIDIYLLSEKIKKFFDEDHRHKQKYKLKEKVAYEDYSGIIFTSKTSEYYIIDSSEYDSTGFINTINYKSNTESPMIIIQSFDINCCQIGYDLKEDKFYWTKEFEEFLNTGELKVVNLCSPAHTAIRIVKKKHDLSAKLNDIELEILFFCLRKNSLFSDIVKNKFRKKYADNFLKYKDDYVSLLDTGKSFFLERDEQLELFLKSKGVEDEAYTLITRFNGNTVKPTFFEDVDVKEVIKIGGIEVPNIKFTLSSDFLFWIRNIFGDKKLEYIWNNLNFVMGYDTKSYLDIDPTNEEIEFLSLVVKNAPNCIKNLKGLTLSNQIKLVNVAFSKFEKLTAIAVLEGAQLRGVDMEDETNLLILELSVRKNIIDDTRGKVNKIFPLVI